MIRRFLTAPLLLSLVACGQAPAGGDTIHERDRTDADPSFRIARTENRGRVIDTAGVLSALEEKTIAARLAALRETRGLTVVVVTLVPSDGDSMERIGWAVSGQRDAKAAAKRASLLLIDPKLATVRIEGALPPEQRAAIVGAMQSELREGRVGSAIGRALEQIQQLPL
ncbi:TPM domain-containing protein [Sphingomonas sp. LHG3443-2]|uniref:TPM domain-containing protein n=1 Tax=Sphingomonas sp. LHG3443-2 TaxID=2804639 RepID=UPI003CFB60FB